MDTSSVDKRQMSIMRMGEKNFNMNMLNSEDASSSKSMMYGDSSVQPIRVKVHKFPIGRTSPGAAIIKDRQKTAERTQSADEPMSAEMKAMI